MNKQIIINKCRLSGLYGKLLLRIEEIDQQTKRAYQNKSIPYSYFYAKMGRGFSIKKQEVRELLFFLRDVGYLEVNQKGVKLNFRIKND